MAVPVRDDERIKALEAQVALLLEERSALGGVVILLDGLLSTLEAERLRYKDRPSLIEMLDTSEVVRSMNQAPSSDPLDVTRARAFAARILQAVRARNPLDPPHRDMPD